MPTIGSPFLISAIIAIKLSLSLSYGCSGISNYVGIILLLVWQHRGSSLAGQAIAYELMVLSMTISAAFGALAFSCFMIEFKTTESTTSFDQYVLALFHIISLVTLS